MEVAGFFHPAFVDLSGQHSDQSKTALFVGEDPHHQSASLEFLIEAFEHVGAFEMRPSVAAVPELHFYPVRLFGVRHYASFASVSR